MKLRRAAVMKILKTFLKTDPSVITERDPEELHEIMSIAWKADIYVLIFTCKIYKIIFIYFIRGNTWKASMKNIHIRSKLLNMCRNVRTSTKFVFDFLAVPRCRKRKIV